jgi:hypothetical protein
MGQKGWQAAVLLGKYPKNVLATSEVLSKYKENT